ncbi:uncharacterized protein CCOS01_02844 [Colletotrichum costaricense]|nr:uncharacterized protein CCOS01_02844 [Colletotrichum costaricense]XP_060387138.1 uncharacterized protein CTAM01_02467 [Colletotrichum tamarilloi]KAI3552668.1 hypothetical protein CSPX01_00417 [Colletotrichum filicis]KAK1508681.1 hypothetical protein CTAM01_02467 [Colletotrichum tamarilloi]KAK1534092.1 hypothetical protein CCOS01_02844 [Colletotrichum costaricense]
MQGQKYPFRTRPISCAHKSNFLGTSIMYVPGRVMLPPFLLSSSSLPSHLDSASLPVPVRGLLALCHFLCQVRYASSTPQAAESLHSPSTSSPLLASSQP